MPKMAGRERRRIRLLGDRCAWQCRVVNARKDGAAIAPAIDGAAVHNSLDAEARRSLHLARRLGLRARHWLTTHRGDSEPTPEFVVESVKVHARIVADLLREQRARAVLARTAVGGDGPTDEQLDRHERELVREALLAMSPAEFDELARARRGLHAIDTTAADAAADGTNAPDVGINAEDM